MTQNVNLPDNSKNAIEMKSEKSIEQRVETVTQRFKQQIN